TTCPKPSASSVSATASRHTGWRGRRGGCEGPGMGNGEWGIGRSEAPSRQFQQGCSDCAQLLPFPIPHSRFPALNKHDFHFDLPPELIAQAPLAERSGSRLLLA